MRRKDKEIIDKQEIENILSTAEICRIAMVDNGQPYLVPVNYGYARNALYVHSSSVGRKIDILKHNNKICFEIDSDYEVVKDKLACNWTAKYRSLIGYGTVEIITDTKEKEKGLDIIMTQHGRSDNNTYDPKHVKAIVILKITIDEISGKQSSY